jgi:hypothetical protein
MEFAGKSNHHPGNIAFRAIIGGHHAEYLRNNRSKKTVMTMELLRDFRAAGVRFLRYEMGGSQSHWLDVGDQLARTKISQALRDSTTPAAAATSAPSTSCDDDPAATDKKRKPTSPHSNRNPKRVVAFHDTILHEPATPAITTAAAATTTNGPREVSPIPPSRHTSTVKGSLFVPSLATIGPSLQQDSSFRTNSSGGGTSSRFHVSPTEASLFELLEQQHEDNKGGIADAVQSSSLPSKHLMSNHHHNPFALPDLPSSDDSPLLRLPSIGIKIWDHDDDETRRLDVAGSAFLEDDEQSRPRKVSPVSFAATSFPADDRRNGGTTTTGRRSWTPATFAMLNDEGYDFDNHLADPSTPSTNGDDDYFVLNPPPPLVNDLVLSPSRRPVPCSNDDDDDWTSGGNNALHHDDDREDDDDGNDYGPEVSYNAAPTTTTTKTFGGATFSAFRAYPYTTIGNTLAHDDNNDDS